jgi:hypothetical protein
VRCLSLIKVLIKLFELINKILRILGNLEKINKKNKNLVPEYLALEHLACKTFGMWDIWQVGQLADI